MTNCTENNSLSYSSSPTSAEMPQDFTAYGRLPFSIRNWGRRPARIRGPARIRKWSEVDDDRTYGDDKEDIPVLNPIDSDDVFLSMVKCHACDFDIQVSSRCGRSKDYDANNLICPVCDEKLEEDAIRTVQKLSFPISRKDNVDGRSFNDFSSDEDNIIGASEAPAAKDISIFKSDGEEADAPNTGSDEQDVEERSDRAAFAQYLFMSALFSE